MDPLILFLGLNISMLFLSLITNASSIKDKLSGVTKATWLLLALIILSGFSMRLVHEQSIQYMDGYWLLGASRGIFETGNPEMCVYTGHDEMSCQEYFKLYGPPLVYSFSSAFGFQGYFALSMILGVSSIALAFVFIRMMFDKSEPALYGSLFLSLSPMFVALSVIIDSDVAGLFFLLSSLIAVVLYVEKEDAPSYSMMLLSLSLLLHMRLELAVFSVMAFSYFFWKGIGTSGLRSGWRFAPVLVYISSLLLLMLNIHPYLDMLVNNTTLLEIRAPEHYLAGMVVLQEPGILYAFLPLGLYALIRKRPGSSALLPVIMLALFGAIMAASFRSLMGYYLAFAVVLATSFWFLASKAASPWRRDILRALLVVVLITSFLTPIYTYYGGFFENSRYKPPVVLQTESLIDMDRRVPDNCYVMFNHPALYSGFSFRSSSIVLNKSISREMEEDTGCLMFFDGLGCYSWSEEHCSFEDTLSGDCMDVFPYKWDYVESCSDVRGSFSLEEFLSYGKEGFRYSLYMASPE